MSLARTLAAFGLVPFGVVPPLGGQALARIERGQADEAERLVPVAFEGIVSLPDGSPAEGAVVVTSAGGKSLTDRNGSYRLEVCVAADARTVQITAVGGAGGSLAASASVDLATGSALVRVAPLELASQSSCQPSWLPTFGGEPGTHGRVFAMTTFDDGSGPALYAGGEFRSAGGAAAERVAKWDGTSWSAVGAGMNDDIRALAVFDDGGGPKLYAGGEFTTVGALAAAHVARWDGTSWSALGSGTSGNVRTLLAFDDGSGPALYVGGSFGFAGGAAANNVARWDGSSWTPLGAGTNNAVYALASFDDGGGPALHVGGDFTTAGGMSANRVAKWNGASWGALGPGVSGSFPIGLPTRVAALAVFDDDGGSALYAAGNFKNAGAAFTSGIGKWDGSTWSGLGSGTSQDAYSLAVFDDGNGDALYVAGAFSSAGGSLQGRIAKWDGSAWTAGSAAGGVYGPVNPIVECVAALDDGTGPALYAGGRFTLAGNVPALDVAKWDGSSWTALGMGINAPVTALSVFDDGGGPALHAGGEFTKLDGVAASYVAKWDGSTWAPLGSGVNPGSSFFPPVSALAVFDDGTGPKLVAGGNFSAAGGVSANQIAKWDGTRWAKLGNGVGADVFALTVFDDGSGAALYAGGRFTTAGVLSANRVARWNGTSWSALGSGIGNGSVNALAVFDDGSGPALYAGGQFTSAGGVAANNVARWDGSGWSALGNGVLGASPNNTYVRALAVFDDGGGPALYAAGEFNTAGSVSANNIARWDGSSWAALGSGLVGGVIALTVRALATFDDGGGPALYAAGSFTTAGGVAANQIARWSGSSWSPLGSGMGGNVSPPPPWVLALTVFNDRAGPALYAGGAFGSALDSGDSYLAKWGCPDTNPPSISCPAPIVVKDPLGSPPGEIVVFTVTAADEEDPTPSLTCTPPSGSLFPRGTTIVTCEATDFSGNQSTCQFTVTVRSKLREL